MVVYTRIPRNLRLGIVALAATATTVLSLTGASHETLAVGFGVIALALAIRSELRLDTARRTYFWCDGIWPIMPSRRGTFDDFARVTIEARESESLNESNEYFRVGIVFTIYLDWSPHVGARPFTIATVRKLENAATTACAEGFRKAARIADEFARQADIPVVEGADLRKLRPEFGPAPYDDRILVPVANRPASMAARLRG